MELKKVKVLVAVQPAPLSRVVHYLLSRPEFRLISYGRNESKLAEEVRRRRPDLMVANMRLLGRSANRIIPALKRASPRTKLIVTGYPRGLGHDALGCGADAYLEEEHLVRHLDGVARRLLGGKTKVPVSRRRVAARFGKGGRHAG